MSPLVLGLAIGAAFGALLSLTGLSSPRHILDMLRLRDFRLVRLLVTAIATGIVGVAVLDSAGYAHTSVKTLHLLAVAGGGALFGTGFALAGYCPGTSLAAAAEGRTDAWFAVGGGLLGTGAFVLAYDALAPLLIEPLTFGKPTVPGVLGAPALLVALPIGVAAAVAVARWRRAEPPSARPRASSPAALA